MIQIKNKLPRIAMWLLLSVALASFNNKPFVFDGGTINNPNMIIAANTQPPAITATNASGCSTTINYQWQQSTDGVNFFDAPNSVGPSYRPGLLTRTTHFRRKAICVRGPHAYTSNVATIIVQ